MLYAYWQLLRLDKPAGIWLLFFPAGWAVGMAATHDLLYFQLLMLLGAFVTRSAGCIINDLIDRKLDGQVARTKNRPLASGKISPRAALWVLTVLLGVALGIALSLPWGVWIIAVLALPMIAAYPFMKRITWWPQVFLGLTFNLSALAGWLAVGAPLTLAPVALYLAAACWTVGYDTIYAIQDVIDDEAAGIKSTAIRVGQYLIYFVALCYFLMVALLGLAGKLAGAGPFYFVGVGAVAIHAIWQTRHVSYNIHTAGGLFRSNQWLGLIFLLFILLDRLIQVL